MLSSENALIRECSHPRMLRPNRIASAPTTTKRRRAREYCRAAAAITKAVNGKGGGARDATARAHPALRPTLSRTRFTRRGERNFSRPFSPNGRIVKSSSKQPSTVLSRPSTSPRDKAYRSRVVIAIRRNRGPRAQTDKRSRRQRVTAVPLHRVLAVRRIKWDDPHVRILWMRNRRLDCCARSRFKVCGIVLKCWQSPPYRAAEKPAGMAPQAISCGTVAGASAGKLFLRKTSLSAGRSVVLIVRQSARLLFRSVQ